MGDYMSKDNNDKFKNDPFELPLTLWLNSNSEPLLQQQMLRKIPGKRWVILAYWGDKQVVVKLFRKYRRAQQELIRAQALQAAGIKTPALVQHDWLQRHPLYALIFEKVDPAIAVDAVWWSSTAKQKKIILSQLILLIAELHEAGFTQNDLHLKNFLISNDEMYAIDAADMVKTADGKSLSERLSLKNLALLFAQLSPEDDINLEEGYTLYARTRGFVFRLDRLAALQKWIRYWRRLHLKVYSKKVFRSTTHLRCQHSWQRFSVIDREYDSIEMKSCLVDPERIMQDPKAKLLKDGNTCTVMQVEIDGRSFVIKRYNIKSFFHGLMRAFRSSRAAISWRNSCCLSSWRLGVIKPVALLEERFGPLRRKAYFISEYVPGNNLKEYFINSPCITAQMEIVARNIVELFTSLGRVRISHGDLKATNILLVDEKPVLLDLDAMRMHYFSRLWCRASQRDQKRFMKNWLELPEIKKLFLNAILPSPRARLQPQMPQQCLDVRSTTSKFNK